MIKYHDINTFSDDGERLIMPASDIISSQSKLASNYSQKIQEFLNKLTKRDDRFYVVINALGSYERWGCNSRGDAFPRDALSHHVDSFTGSPMHDYGYKSFEHYAKYFRHHDNKPSSPSYGEVLFSYWNPFLERVELVVAIDRFKENRWIKELLNGGDIATSMGCFTDPNFPILVKDRGYIKISEIKKGDQVLTHKGNWKKVTEVMKRKYTGGVSELKVKGLPIPIELTDEHPMMAKSFKMESNNRKRPYNTPEQFEKVEFDWAHAGCLEKGDHIQYAEPKYSTDEYTKIGDVDLARIMGFYLAEGSIQYCDGNENIVCFTCHIDDEMVREIPKIVNKCFPGTTCEVIPKNNSKSSVSLLMYSARLARFLKSFVWTGSHKKIIPPEIFVSDRDVKLAFVGAWLSGDGWCDTKGAHWSSCNFSLVMLGRDLLMSCGIPSSIYKIVHPAGNGFSINETTEYTLNISCVDAEPLTKYSEMKLSKLNNLLKERKKTGNSCIRINADSTKSYSIKEINKRYVEDIYVYNFEVEDDNSYSAAGLVSHNCNVPFDVCNICGNKAPTVKQYCVHARDHLRSIVSPETAAKWSVEVGRTILPGTQVCVLNTYPIFFDISRVWRGADNTSFILTKAASSTFFVSGAQLAESYNVTDDDFNNLVKVAKKKIAKKKCAAIIKNIPASDIDGKAVAANISEKKKVLESKVEEAINDEPLLPNNILDHMSQNYSLPSILSSMISLGIHPKPTEFQRIVIIAGGKNKGLADKLDQNGEIFPKCDRCSDFDNQIDISPKNISYPLQVLLSKFASNRSCYPDLLIKRIRTGQHTVKKQASKLSAAKINPSLKDIGKMYASLGNKIKKSKVLQDKYFPLKLIFGSLLGMKLFGPDFSNDDVIGSLPAEDYENILQGTIDSENNKVASLIALPMIYKCAAYDQEAACLKNDLIDNNIFEYEIKTTMSLFNK